MLVHPTTLQEHGPGHGRRTDRRRSCRHWSAPGGCSRGSRFSPRGPLGPHAARARQAPANPSFALAFAALLHDVGKPGSKGLRHGRTSFHNHEQIGRAIRRRASAGT